MAASDASKPLPLLVRILRTVLRALLIAFAIGFGLGTWLRCAADRAEPRALPYLGERAREAGSDRPA